MDDPSIGLVEVKEVTDVDGEAVANNRKAKLIFFYEWNIKGKWRGRRNGDTNDVKGTFEITNLSEENDANEVEVLVSLSDKSNRSDSADILKELMRKKGADAMRSVLEQYIHQLKTDFAKDLIKPSKDSVNSSNTHNTQPVTESKLAANSGPSLVPSKAKVNPLADLKTLKLKEEMKCRKEEIFRAMTQVELVSAFTRGPAVSEPEANGQFSYFGGNVSGTFVSVTPDQEIRQKWRFKSWPEGHFSEVCIQFEEKADHTLVTVSQTGIPSNDVERTENGWKTLYFQSLKQTFGFGSILC